MGVDSDQYGLFLPPKEEQAGKWCRDDYPLSFYGLEGEKESKEAHLMTNPATVVRFMLNLMLFILVFLLEFVAHLMLFDFDDIS